MQFLSILTEPNHKTPSSSTSMGRGRPLTILAWRHLTYRNSCLHSRETKISCIPGQPLQTFKYHSRHRSRRVTILILAYVSHSRFAIVSDPSRREIPPNILGRVSRIMWVYKLAILPYLAESLHDVAYKTSFAP